MQERGAVTARDVAARANVSLSTVSSVLNRPERVAAATRERVQQAVRDLGYVRNDAARSLRLGRSQAVGMMVSESTSPFYAEVIRAADTELAARGYSLLVGSAYHDDATAHRLVRLFEEQRVCGLLLNPFARTPLAIDVALREGIPSVHLDAIDPRAGHCSVTTDHFAGGRLAIQHVAALGRKRVALVRGPAEVTQIMQRFQGAARACAELGLECEEVVTSTYFVRGGAQAGGVLASRPAAARPDVVFAANDIIAMGLVAALDERGISVPTEISVVGYDDTDFALAARVPLTTVRQPAVEIGVRAATLLIEEIEGAPGHQHEETLLLPELIVRGSTLAGL